MKRLFLLSAALGLAAPVARAEITLTGDARMGVLSDQFALETAFTSRARLAFTLTAETDSGLFFGATFRADQADDAASGNGGEVWVLGDFGRLSMGDVDGAAHAAVGQVSGAGLTGLRNLHEVDYHADASGGAGPSVLYEYSVGAFSGYLSLTNPAGGTVHRSAGVKYATDTLTFAAGYETEPDFGMEHLVLGASGRLGSMTAKAVFSQVRDLWGATDYDVLALSLDYSADALTVTGFYRRLDAGFGGHGAQGVGASYDLGNGASLVGGYAKQDGLSRATWDLGLSFSF